MRGRCRRQDPHALDNPARSLSVIYGMRGYARARLGESDAAIEDCRHAIDALPENREAHDTLIRELLGAGRFDEALAASDAAMAISPDTAELHSLRGSVLGRLQRSEEAVASVERAISLDPGIRAAVYALRADLLWNARRQPEAIAAYTEALARCGTPEEYALVAGSLATIAKYQAAVIASNDAAQTPVAESKAADYTSGIMSDLAAEFHAVADDALKSGVPLAEFRDAIKKLAAKAGTTARGPAARATAEPRPKLDARSLSGSQVVAVIEDSTLGRLHRRYTELLATVELPPDGFKNLKQARAGGLLSSTFNNLQARRAKVGLEPLPKDDRVAEAKRLSVAFYRSKPRPAPSRRSRAARTAALG